MANDQARKSQRPKLTPEQQARIEAIRAKNRTPEARPLSKLRAVKHSAVSAVRREPSRRRAMVPPWANWWHSLALSWHCAASESDWDSP